ncbi:MAG: endonuclease domain-containing protein [Planctomycetaceae bacterium]
MTAQHPSDQDGSGDHIEDWMLSRARELRRDLTIPERLLWGALRGKRVGGYKFRRQVPIGNYIVDFLCMQRKVIVEVDGESHQGRVAADRIREEQLNALGYRIIRVSNDDVLQNLEGVCEGILRFIDGRPAM